MHSEYRVVDTELPDGKRQFSVRRVVFDQDKIVYISEEVYPRGDTLIELTADINKLLTEAVARPVLVDPLTEEDWQLVFGDEAEE